LKVLGAFKLSIPVVAVAKGKTRKNLNLQFSEVSQFSEEISKLLKDKRIVKWIMDEAHRFAVAYHRKIRARIFRG
jgi:excinuclease UvrABC nuclease subunit